MIKKLSITLGLLGTSDTQKGIEYLKRAQALKEKNKK